MKETHLHTFTRSYVHTLIAALLMLAPTGVLAQSTHVLLIGGLGGSPEHTETFRGYLFETHRAFTESLGVPEGQVTVLAEQAIQDEPFVDGVSNAETIRAAFEDLAEEAGAEEMVYVVLFGHGSFDGERAQLNIPRRDLGDADYAELVGTLEAGRVVFVNTASASAPFASALSGADRIVITATRSPTQRNETVFPQHFVAALTDPAADADYSGSLSVLDVFRYAAERTARGYSTEGLLATEDALLEDTGDGQGARFEELDERGEGALAAVTYLRRDALAQQTNNAEAAPLLDERTRLERQIAALKSRKSTLGEDAYYAQLETLFVQLARLNDQIEGF